MEHLKESALLGSQLPASEDFAPIIREIRQKYKLPEISPDDDPIDEIYLEDKLIPLDDFRQEIEDMIRQNLNWLPPKTLDLYTKSKNLEKPLAWTGYEMLPSEIKETFEAIYKFAQNMSEPIVKLLDAQIVSIANMLYTYILTGESEEVPNDWISKVYTMSLTEEPVVVAMASQVANPEAVTQQFHQQFNKTFGSSRPKLTDKIVSTGYYIQLQRLGKPWRYIVEEFIRRNKYQLPRDRNSKRFFDTWHLYEQRLRKRIKKTETVLDILVMEKKSQK